MCVWACHWEIDRSVEEGEDGRSRPPIGMRLGEAVPTTGGGSKSDERKPDRPVGESKWFYKIYRGMGSSKSTMGSCSIPIPSHPIPSTTMGIPVPFFLVNTLIGLALFSSFK